MNLFAPSGSEISASLSEGFLNVWPVVWNILESASLFNLTPKLIGFQILPGIGDAEFVIGYAVGLALSSSDYSSGCAFSRVEFRNQPGLPISQATSMVSCGQVSFFAPLLNISTKPNTFAF